jgi:hypothetical protein
MHWATNTRRSTRCARKGKTQGMARAGAQAPALLDKNVAVRVFNVGAHRQPEAV